MIKGVIFDMDGVITDNNSYHEKAWAEFCLSYGIRLSVEEVHQYIFGRVAGDTLEYVFKRKLNPGEIEKFVKQKEKIYRDLYSAHIKPVNGLIQFIQELRQNKYKLAMATSAPPGNVEFTFEHIPIREFFDVILDASRIQYGKPNPEIYQKAIGMLNLNPAECLIFEDSLPGIRAAIDSGAYVVGLSTTHEREYLKGPARIIRDFTEIKITDLNKIREIV